MGYLIVVGCMAVILSVVVYVSYRRISVKSRKLRDQENLLKLISGLFDELSIGFALKDAEDSFRYLMVNRMFAMSFGLDREKMLGKNTEDLEQKDLKWVVSRDEETCEKGFSSVSEYYRIEDTVMKSYRNTRKRFVSEDGHRYVLSMVNDVTCEKTMERDFDEYRKKLEISIEASQMSLWEYNIILHKIFFYGNDRSLWGDSLSMDRFINMIYSDDQQHVYDSFQKLIAGNEDSENVIFRLMRENNDYRWIRIYMRILERDLQTGMVLRLVGLYKDVTEEQIAMQELERLRSNK